MWLIIMKVKELIEYFKTKSPDDYVEVFHPDYGRFMVEDIHDTQLQIRQIVKPFSPGDEVNYDGQNGVVKMVSHTGRQVWVVFKCNNDWINYMDYTAQLVWSDELKKGWIIDEES